MQDWSLVSDQPTDQTIEPTNKPPNQPINQPTDHPSWSSKSRLLLRFSPSSAPHSRKNPSCFPWNESFVKIDSGHQVWRAWRPWAPSWCHLGTKLVPPTLKSSATLPSCPYCPSRGFRSARGLSLLILLKLYLKQLKWQQQQHSYCENCWCCWNFIW